MKKQFLTAVALGAAGALILAGCSGDPGSGGSGDSGPIVVGSINTLSGNVTVPEASQAAAAVFDEFNEAGGLDGRTIKYVSKDDEGDVAKAGTLAREVVGDDDAVAMVGGASMIACQANSDYFKAKGILSIPGIGIDKACFNSPVIAPANVGPFNDMTLSLLYGSQVLGLDHICVLLQISGNTKSAYMDAIHRWEKLAGQKVAYLDDTVPYGAPDYTPYLVKAKSHGCTAILNNASEADAVAIFKNANAMGWQDVTWLELTSIYSENLAESIDHTGNGLYLPAEFYPFTDVNEQTKDWRDLMQANDIKLTAFSQGGYLAAQHFIKVLKQMKADGQDITRENVAKALHDLTGDNAIENPMIGTPYTFGTAKKHEDNTCAWPIQLMSGTNKWEHADKGGDDWLCLSSN